MRLSTVVGSLAIAVALLATRDAAACGGCFVQASSPTVVSGHRMVISVSSQQTVLWDQIQYAGNPTEFAWVLPVKPGARIEAATQAFFEVLEGATKRNITSPPVNCNGGSATPACAVQLLSASGDFEGEPTSPVTVVHEGSVGPYETVTLQTSQPGALNQWLADHNYNVDASSQPIIDAYVADGFDFIAIRLQPGKDVRQMTPVRVVSPGSAPTLPLRMVAIGTGAKTPIVLYVIGEGRWNVQNFPVATLQAQLLAYDFKTKKSNYAAIREAALAENGGRGWLTAYAEKGALVGAIDPGSFSIPFDFMGAYATEAVANGEAPSSCKISMPSVLSNPVVVNPCPDGEPLDSPKCTNVTSSGSLDIRSLTCSGADDIGVALLGMHPRDVWLTRLEAELPHAALDADLSLAAAEAQVAVSRDLTALIAENADKACPSTVLFPSLRTPTKPPSNAMPFLFATGFALACGALAARRLGPRARI